VTWEQIIGLSLALVVMLIGLLGSILPVLPGPRRAPGGDWASAIFWRASINTVLLVLVVLTVVSGLDF
jgi:hypothetical protein